MTGRKTLRIVLAAFLTSLLLTAAKSAVAVFSRSSAMVAEAIHSACDSFNQALLLVGMKKCEREADEIHPFGFSLDSYFWSFIVAIILLITGALVSLYEGIARIREPRPIAHLPLAIGVLLLSLAAELVLFRTSRSGIKMEKGRSSTLRYLRRKKKSELVVLFQENLAAIIGVIIAAALVTLAHLTGNLLYDAVASIAIGVLLAMLALFRGLETRLLLIGESADPEMLRRIYRVLHGEESIKRIIHIRSLQLGPDDVLLAIKAEFDPLLNTSQVANLISGIEKEIRSQFPNVKKIFMEPEIFDPTRQIRLS